MADLTKEIPVIDASLCDSAAECKRVAKALAKVGCFAFRGTSVDSITPKLTDMLVEYYRQPDQLKDHDVRPEYHHQVGRTPAYTETAQPRPDKLALLRPEYHPYVFSGPDPKERFMAPAGPRPTTKEYQEFAAPPVIPNQFPEWTSLTDAWNEQAINVMMTVSRMAAVGFGLKDKEAFASLLQGGPHLFAPTGSNLLLHGAPGTVLAGWHDDLNFLSVHGKSNFPGLRIWKRNGETVWVKVPDGCMLVQAGQQFEYLTGGEVLAGLHEVVSTEGMQAGIDEAEKADVVPWRVSTTLFGHVASDLILQPLEKFATRDAVAKYPPIKAGEQVLRELKLLGLAIG